MPITLPDDWSANERGNTWLVSGEGEFHVGYFNLPGGQMLEVTVTPPNYPGFKLAVFNQTETTDGTLAAHVTGLIKNGWLVRKCNIDGVDLNASDTDA